MEEREINPFQCGRPVVDPADFFGRRVELQRLSSLLRPLHWVSIVGPRRIGKTSLLMQLCHPRTVAEMGLGAPEYGVAFINCSGLMGLDAAGWRALLISRAAEALGVFPAPEVGNGFQFREAFRRLVAGGRKLILLLDEFEDLAANPHLDADFFGGLRALSTGYPVAIVTASRLPLITLTYRDASLPSSPFFNPFVSLRLGLLEESEAQALLARPGANLGAKTIDLLLSLAGRHPFYLQIAGHLAFERQRREPLAATAPDGLCEAVQEALEPHLIYAWEHLSEEARYALVTLPLARAGQAGLDELRDACLTEKGKYLSSAVERFARRQSLPDVLQARGLWADLRRQQAVWWQQPLSLGNLTFAVLCYFLAHPDQPIPWLQLETEVWGQFEELPPDYAGNPERVDARVDALRRTLREAGVGNPISFRGGAYTFALDLIVPGP